jgi:hypothetical protein
MRRIERVPYGLAALVLGLALGMGCRSHHNGLPTPGEGAAPPSPEQLDQANGQRLAPVAQPASSQVAGRITLSGFTLLDGMGTALDNPGQANGRILAQLIDEEDDILCAKNPSQAGDFTLDYTGPFRAVKLRVLAYVQEDLDGSGQGGDQLQLVVPVSLVAGRAATVNLTLRRGGQADVDPSLRPTRGEFAVCDAYVLDGTGQHATFYGVFFAGAFVVISTDGDRFLEMGDDLRLPDLDHNGWPDSDEAAYNDSLLAATTVSGHVTTVDTANQTLTVRDAGGVQVLVFVSPFCAIETFSGSSAPGGMGGEFFGARQLGVDLIGKAVTATGRMGPGGLVADQIAVAMEF